MAAVKKVLVIGGGFSGMAAAIELRKAGIARRSRRDRSRTGAPKAPASRSTARRCARFETLGVYDEIAKRGYRLRTASSSARRPGQKIGEIPTPQGRGLRRPGRRRHHAPRPRAHSRRRDARERRRSADSAAPIESIDDRRRRRRGRVHRRNARRLRSRRRRRRRATPSCARRCFPRSPPPQYIGQVVWRAVLPRPAEIVRPRMWMGGAGQGRRQSGLARRTCTCSSPRAGRRRASPTRATFAEAAGRDAAAVPGSADASP